VVDGVMLGRAAYHDWLLAAADPRLAARRRRPARGPTWCARWSAMPRARPRGVPMRAIARHALGLYHGVPGGRRYRRLLSEPRQLQDATPQLFLDAMAMVGGEARTTPSA
jgi:tRNA-dihydrouridine synthase A